MGVGSLVLPLATHALVSRYLTPGKGRFGKVLVGTAVGATIATTVADRFAAHDEPDADDRPSRPARGPCGGGRDGWLGVGGPVAIATGGLAITSTLSDRTSATRMWRKGQAHDRGNGPLAWALGDRRLGLHLLLEPPVHARGARDVGHPRRPPLERALQPVDRAAAARRRRARRVAALRAAVPGGHPAGASCSRPGASTSSTSTGSTPTRSARSATAEEVLNTPSHHRVHHGSNQKYIDRNHGSILIIWDRLFGTFQREEEPVVYGLTKNIETYSPAAHRHARVPRHRPRRGRVDDVARPPVVRAARAGLGLRPPRRASPPLHRRRQLELS